VIFFYNKHLLTNSNQQKTFPGYSK